MTQFTHPPSVHRIATPHDLSPKFLRDVAELLGIPPDALKYLRVTLEVDKPVIVEASYYVIIKGQPVIDEAKQSLIEETGRWELVRIE